MTVETATGRERLDLAAAALTAAGIATARTDAEWLLASELGVGRSALALHLDEALAPGVARGYAGAVRRRVGREPLQHVMGWEGFRGLRITVTSDVLVPRPETEVLVEWALALLAPAAAGGRPLVVDVGTGSGCIACALAVERRDARVLGTEISPSAASVARANVKSTGLDGAVAVVVTDLVAGIADRSADLLVANLPYLPTGLLATLEPEVRDHEPRAALDGGPDGLTVVRRLVADAGRVLRPGGIVLLETAGGGQVAAAAGLLAGAGLSILSTRQDLAGVERFVGARARRG